jgi:hypothetical protein
VALGWGLLALPEAREVREHLFGLSETATIGTASVNSTLHYAGPGESVAWAMNNTSGSWSRNITGINGGLVAIQGGSKEPSSRLLACTAISLPRFY